MVVSSAEACQRRPARQLASAPPPAAIIRRRDSIGLLCDQGLFSFGDVPEHDVVVRLLDAGMTSVVVEADMVHLASEIWLRDTAVATRSGNQLVFLSSDKSLVKAAAGCGLETFNPEINL